MVTDKLFAAQKFASKDTAKELPAWLGGAPGTKYQKTEKNIFITEAWEKIPKILLTDWKSMAIRDFFQNAGTYPLPNGRELKIAASISWKNTYTINEKAWDKNPKWALNGKWQLEEIKETA
jgi:hypothetical protein